jgi:5,10-methylenetetrahydromethanopterin reductase
MKSIRVGLSYGVGRREPITRVPQIAALVERSGFGRLWFVDYQIPMKDAVVALTLAAGATERIELGPGVANSRTRHLSVLANAMSTIHELSHGRAIVGFGGGHTAVYGVGLKPSSASQVEADVNALKALLAGEEANTDGRAYRLHTLSELPRPRVCMAATQELMLRAAGRSADAVILMGAADVSMTQWQLDRIHEGLAEAGRGRGDIDIEIWFALSLGDDDKAVDDVKAWAAAQARVLNRWKGELPSGLAGFKDELRLADANYLLEEHLSVNGANSRLVSDDLALRLAVAGNARTCAERILELVELGLDGVTISLLSGGREERIRRLSEELLPLLSGREARQAT